MTRREERRARHRRQRIVRGALTLTLYLLLASGVGMAAVGWWRYSAGFDDGHAQASAERDSHWQSLVSRMQAEAGERLAAETKKATDLERHWVAEVIRVGEALETERRTTARLRGDFAGAVQRARVLDSRLAAVATGGRTEAEDTVAACRERADALGRVLGEALRASEQCSLDAEDLAAGIRALRGAWPASE